MKRSTLPASAFIVFSVLNTANAAVITCDNANYDIPRTAGTPHANRPDNVPVAVDLLGQRNASSRVLTHLHSSNTGLKKCKTDDCEGNVLDRYRKLFGNGSTGESTPDAGEPQLPPTSGLPKPQDGLAELPEPPTWGLTVAGLLLAGFMRKRARLTDKV